MKQRQNIKIGDMVRLKGEKREGRVVQTYQTHDGKTFLRVVYPSFDEDGIPSGPGESVTGPETRFERPRAAKGDLAYSRTHDVEGVVVYERGQYVTLRPVGGGLPVNTTKGDLVRLNHYSEESDE